MRFYTSITTLSFGLFTIAVNAIASPNPFAFPQGQVDPNCVTKQCSGVAPASQKCAELYSSGTTNSEQYLTCLCGSGDVQKELFKCLDCYPDKAERDQVKDSYNKACGEYKGEIYNPDKQTTDDKPKNNNTGDGKKDNSNGTEKDDKGMATITGVSSWSMGAVAIVAAAGLGIFGL